MAKYNNFQTQPKYSWWLKVDEQRRLLIVRLRIPFFSSSSSSSWTGTIQPFCVTVYYFALKGPVTATLRGCRWCVQCGGNVAWIILLKWKHSTANMYMPHGYSPPLHLQQRQSILLMALETNLFCILLCDTVLHRFPCFQLVYSWHHICTKYKRALHVMRYYITLHLYSVLSSSLLST